MSNEQATENPFILFEILGTTYAVPSSSVRQVEMVEHVTPVPNAPAAVDGVVFSRGQVIPAINLRTRFGFPKVEYDLRTRMIVIETDQRKIGLIVDSAREFRKIPAAAISPPPESLSGMSGRYLDGIATLGERLILLLNLSEVLKTLDELETEIEN